MKNTARVIITTKCYRDCKYCVNKQAHVIKQATRISDITSLKYYREVLITGGEPTLYPDDVISAAKKLHKQNPNVLVYLYTTLLVRELEDILQVVDGVTYTIHKDATETDIKIFVRTQELFQSFKNHSFLLSIDKDLDKIIPIIPSVWKHVKIKGWKTKCIVPVNEDLYILKDVHV